MITVALLFCVSSSARSARAESPFQLSIGGGASLPVSPEWLRDFHGAGFHIQGLIGREITPAIRVNGKIEFHHIRKDWDRVERTGDSIDGADLSIWMLGLDAKFSGAASIIPGKLHAFVGSGGARILESGVTTIGSVDLSPYDVKSLEDQNRWYVHFGGGFEYPTNIDATFFAEARYLSLLTEDGSLVFVPLTLGFRIPFPGN
jgi:hypothetical protein